MAATSGANFAAGMRRLIERVGREPEPDELEPLTWASLKAGRQGDRRGRAVGLQEMRRLNRDTLALFETFDVYLTPVMGTPPPPIGYIDPVGLTPKRGQPPPGRGVSLHPAVQRQRPALDLPAAGLVGDRACRSA